MPETAKGEVGLDQHQVQSWARWRPHVALSLLTRAYLAVARCRTAQAGGAVAAPDLLPPTSPEVRRLLWCLLWAHSPVGHGLAWATWRRRHQARARRCHYRRDLHRLRDAARPA